MSRKIDNERKIEIKEERKRIGEISKKSMKERHRHIKKKKLQNRLRDINKQREIVSCQMALGLVPTGYIDEGISGL